MRQLRTWLSWLALMALITSATWACLQVGTAFRSVREAAQRTASAMEGTYEYERAVWDPTPLEVD